MTAANEASELVERRTLHHHEQMADAQSQCIPCKLCGGSAVISDAGTGAGYYIACSNSRTHRSSEGCLLSERRLSGWAYNVMDWWNRLHRPEAADRIAALEQENAELRQSVVAFGAPWAVSYAKDFGLAEGELHPTHYDILEAAGARMDSFKPARIDALLEPKQ